MIEFAYGLDFGTSKTALSRAKCGGGPPTAEDLRLEPETGEARLPSCLLVEGSNVLAIGRQAEDEFHLVMEGSNGRRFSTNFKPHIHNDPQARTDAALFLARVARIPEVSKQVELDRGVARTIVGRPASWPSEAECTLLDLVSKAGFPEPMTLPEPVGAMFYHLAVRMKADDVKGEILVVDWGAGTCDFTVMRNGRSKPEDSWGSNVYGGRLLDDLFYQWILEVSGEDPQNRDALRRLRENPQLDAYLLWQVARDVKERYSDRSRGNRWPFQYPRPVAVGTGRRTCFLGYFGVDTPDDFTRRARSYVASPRMQERLLAARGDALDADRPYMDRLLRSEPVDLLSWAGDLLRAGDGRMEDVDTVVLTGGSSRWPWFEALFDGARPEQPCSVYTDSQPELSIARGLGRAYAIGLHAQSLLGVLAQAEGAFVRELFDRFLYPRLDGICDGTIDALLADCYQSEILPALHSSDVESSGRLAASIERWFDHAGWARFEAGLDALNTAAGAAIDEVATHHGIHLAGLLGMAAEACCPLAKRDWSSWIAATDWKARLVRGAIAAVRVGLSQIVVRLARLVEDLFMALFGSAESQASVRQARELERRERVRVHLASTLRSVVRNHPDVKKWGDEVVRYFRDTLSNLAEIATPSGAGARAGRL